MVGGQKTINCFKHFISQRFQLSIEASLLTPQSDNSRNYVFQHKTVFSEKEIMQEEKMDGLRKNGLVSMELINTTHKQCFAKKKKK